MYKKFCLGCRSYSYSAKGEGRWTCPTCGVDLTLMPILQLKEKYNFEEIKDGN